MSKEIHAYNGEIVVYQPDNILKVNVILNEDTVWLTQEQLAQIFAVKRPAITKHIKNIYECGELDELSTCSILEHMGNSGQQIYRVKYFNLDMILSVGYRVNSKSAIAFRRWASHILKDYMLKGYTVNQRLLKVEEKLEEHSRKIDYFVKSSLPPLEGIFFDGQIYDSYTFVSDLIRNAVRQIILIDNYIDDTVLTLLNKRKEDVSAMIYTSHVTKELKLDIKKHNAQYRAIDVREFKKSHDRFMIIDNNVYLIGASLKDLGKKWFGFTLIKSITPEEIISRL